MRMLKRDKLALRMSSLAAMQTSCHLTRDAVSLIVVTFVRAQGHPAATEASNFTNDVPVDPAKRAGWAPSLRMRVIAAGCDPKGFAPSDCAQARKVAGIVDALFKAL
jgi:hypothetical protein